MNIRNAISGATINFFVVQIQEAYLISVVKKKGTEIKIGTLFCFLYEVKKTNQIRTQI